jgi:hypothetical protein
MSLAPIAFFAYKRPSQTLVSLESLSQCELAQDSKLFIFCDGAKNKDEDERVNEVRRIAAQKDWCGQVEIRHQERNRGLAKSLISGITELCERYGRVIVIEDDLVLSRGFLSYINLALDKYADKERVLQVSGHVFPFTRKNVVDSAFFLPVATCQGWGTWARAWNLFDEKASGQEEIFKNKNVRNDFDLDGAFIYSHLLKEQLNGNIDSWAIRWWLTFFRQSGLCLYPSRSLLKNIGIGGDDATHTKDQADFYNDPSWSIDRFEINLPGNVEADAKYFIKLKQYFALNIPGCHILRRLCKYVKISLKHYMAILFF